MMTLIEDVRLFLQQWCRTAGSSGAVANVVPVVVLGIVLNAAALSVVKSVRIEERPSCQKIAMGAAARTELKVVRSVVVSTLKTISRGQRGWCLARSWVDDLPPRELVVCKLRGTLDKRAC